jgi:hypothetical protein
VYNIGCTGKSRLVDQVDVIGYDVMDEVAAEADDESSEQEDDAGNGGRS